MYANKVDNLKGTVTDMGLVLDNTNGTLSAYVTKTDNNSKTITDLGLRIDGINDSLYLYATSSELSGLRNDLSASIEVNARSITQKVSTTDYNGDTVVSMINQTASTVTIKGNKIDLNGVLIDHNGKIYASLIDADSITSNIVKIGKFRVGRERLGRDPRDHVDHQRGSDNRFLERIRRPIRGKGLYRRGVILQLHNGLRVREYPLRHAKQRRERVVIRRLLLPGTPRSLFRNGRGP